MRLPELLAASGDMLHGYESGVLLARRIAFSVVSEAPTLNGNGILFVELGVEESARQFTVSGSRSAVKA